MPAAALSTPWLFWLNYLLLASGSFALWLPRLTLTPLPVLVLALLLRRMARIRGDEALGAAHAQWQLETFWLFLLLFLALLALFLGMGLIFNEGTALDRVEGIANAFSNGSLDIYETLARFWNIREIRWFTWAGLFWALLVLLWPLQRTVQGILALCAERTPRALSGGMRWLALGLAVLMQSGFLVVVLAL